MWENLKCGVQGEVSFRINLKNIFLVVMKRFNIFWQSYLGHIFPKSPPGLKCANLPIFVEEIIKAVINLVLIFGTQHDVQFCI